MKKVGVTVYLSSKINSGLNFFFSTCCLAESTVTNAHVPPMMLAIPNIAVPSNMPAIVIPNVPVASPHGILLFIFIILLLTVIYKLVSMRRHRANLCPRMHV